MPLFRSRSSRPRDTPRGYVPRSLRPRRVVLAGRRYSAALARPESGPWPRPAGRPGDMLVQ